MDRLDMGFPHLRSLRSALACFALLLLVTTAAVFWLVTLLEPLLLPLLWKGISAYPMSPQTMSQSPSTLPDSSGGYSRQSLTVLPQRPFGGTNRTDRWWLTPLAVGKNFKPQTEALMAIARFVDDMGDGGSTAAIVEHVLAMAHGEAA